MSAPPPPIWITATLLEGLLALEDGASAELSLDLNLTRTPVRRSGDVLETAAGPLEREQLLRWQAEGEVKDDRVYRIRDGELDPVEVRLQRYAKLAPAGDAPALVLDGITMHIARNDTPWRTTREMARAVRPTGRAVLDCCGGLGYVALHLCELGARSVLSVERCPEVLALRRENPWSQLLADQPQLELVIGDIRKVVRTLEPSTFGAVVHDPPRISRQTGDLYGRPFYRELYRVLAPGGWLLHYVGRPGVTRGLLHTANVPKRLREVGFDKVRELDKIGSLLTRKPTSAPF